jgi:hypothetical protein
MPALRRAAGLQHGNSQHALASTVLSATAKVVLLEGLERPLSKGRQGQETLEVRCTCMSPEGAICPAGSSTHADSCTLFLQLAKRAQVNTGPLGRCCTTAGFALAAGAAGGAC